MLHPDDGASFQSLGDTHGLAAARGEANLGEKLLGLVRPEREQVATATHHAPEHRITLSAAGSRATGAALRSRFAIAKPHDPRIPPIP